MELLKLLSANEVFVQVIGFLILLFLLRKFAWGKILGLLDARREKIAEEFKKIEESKAEIAKINLEYTARLRSIEESANAKINQAIAHGRRITEEMRQAARQEAQVIIESADLTIRTELSKAKEELKDKIVDLTITAVENLIHERLTDKDDRKIVEDFLGKIGDKV